MQYRGGVQYRGRYHDTCGGYLEYRGGYLEYLGDTQYYGGIMMNVEDIMSTVGVQYRGGTILCNLSTVGDIMIHVGEYNGYRGVFSTMGYSNSKRFFPPQY